MLFRSPDMKHIPGVDMSSGSLGQGISCAVGMALAGKMDHKDYRSYPTVLLPEQTTFVLPPLQLKLSAGSHAVSRCV